MYKKINSSTTRFYKTWEAMKSRCNNKNNVGYLHYGGRGIKVCKRWNNNFSLYEKDMYPSYKDELTLDRIDTNGDYSKENCRWSTYIEQNKNRRDNVKYKGECGTDASFRLGGHSDLVNKRIRYGWTKERAFTTYVIAK